MKIALIGASGFVGTRLIDLLKNEPAKYELKNIDLLPSHFFNEITTIGDVTDQEQMNQMLKGFDLVVLLAAQHRDDVSPTSLYYDVNVGGMEKTLKAMEVNGVKRLVFFSSVAVFGLNKPNPAEDYEPKEPFNHYGKSKWQAEQVAEKWFETHKDWNIDIIRPTVIFGERNRGNVYNLLKQIAGGKFLMVGKGDNCKSMAYVGNIVAFVKYMIDEVTEGYNVFNYIDKPDMTMNELVPLVSKVLNKHIPSVHFPYWLGMCGGYCFDALAFVTGKKLAISSVRVKKFCATTQFCADKVLATGFKAPYTLAEGLSRTLEFEFVHPRTDAIEFVSE
ncbi:MAG: NAD-dependent epimerase/dehydratase family protein [Prevotellaceae bacterium]|nr:NAD-dependent epimerase/dehydratase family protein [Prevotellaceae bacterium]